MIHLDRMTAAGSTAQGIQQPFTVTNAVVTLPEEVSKITLADWHDSAAEYIRSELFNKKQFADDEELMMGGRIQELVCVNIHICGLERARLYWDEKGGGKSKAVVSTEKADGTECDEASIRRYVWELGIVKRRTDGSRCVYY